MRQKPMIRLTRETVRQVVICGGSISLMVTVTLFSLYALLWVNPVAAGVDLEVMNEQKIEAQMIHPAEQEMIRVPYQTDKVQVSWWAPQGGIVYVD